ncbi:MAG: dihydropteroate synthase [Deltaproteobacteria bacterium]|nr:dihydropteroate synthase [Deltaproteobacteria bacterium]
MGVLNVTPDSFSDGGEHFDPGRACAKIDEMIEQGARIIDVGGESTRPRHTPVPADEQLKRTSGPIRHAADRGALVSIDTTDPSVARAAIDAGARIVNDVSCLRGSDALARVAAETGSLLIMMHAREPMTESSGFAGTPEDAYGDVVADVRREWLEAEARAERAGLARKHILFDPGIGFNKSARHSAELVRRLDELVSMGFPVVIGPSRKSFLVAEVKTEPHRRLGGTAAACIAAAARGAAVLRVHDVIEVRQALAVARAVGLLLPPKRKEATHA